MFSRKQILQNSYNYIFMGGAAAMVGATSLYAISDQDKRSMMQAKLRTL